MGAYDNRTEGERLIERRRKLKWRVTTQKSTKKNRNFLKDPGGVIVAVVFAPKFGMTGQEVARSSSSLNGCGGAIYGRRRRRKKAYADGKGSLEARIYHEDDSGSRGTMQ